MSSSDDSGGIGTRISQGWASFSTFLYNSEEGTVLGRTGKSWGKILIFYLIYYGFLACLFAASISIVMNTLDDYTPKFQTRVQAPGMTIQPKTPSDDDQTSNIVFKMSDATSYGKYNKILNEFLYKYDLSNQTSPDFKPCEKGDANINQQYEGDDVAKSCKFDKGVLGPCSSGTYGYDKGQPCILLKVNRIIGWYPIGYTNLSKAVGNSDSRAPPLKDVLQAYDVKYDPYLMYMACYGSKDEDKKNLGGDYTGIKYYPTQNGVGFQYYPYFGKKRQPSYINPIIAVQFMNVTNDVDITVRCKAYAANIEDSERLHVGFFKFVLRVNK